MSTILIIDDDETVLELIAATVRFLGYASLSTLYPTQTFQILEKNSIDLILLDVHMPVLNGIALLRQIISHPVYKKIPVIMLTIDDDEKLLEKCFESGAVDFITKPVQKLVLKSRIKTALSTQSHIDQLADINKNLEKKVEERTLELHKSEERFRKAFDLGVVGMATTDPQTHYFLTANKRLCEIVGYSEKELLKKTWVEITQPQEKIEGNKVGLKKIVEGKVNGYIMEKQYVHKDGHLIDITLSVQGVKKADGTTDYFVVLIDDITERKEAEELLREQKKVLEQKNIALGEVLSHIELEKKEMRDNVIANAENLLLPIVEKIRLKGGLCKYINLLEKSLKELTSSFGAKLSKKKAKLTSREIEICNMVKNGLASKEIADLLNISGRTVERHRNNIRIKLGIRKKDINLTSFLKTL